MTGKLRGYNPPLAGRPVGEVKTVPEPKVLRLPLRTEHFGFSGNVFVTDGETVHAGQILATDGDAFDLPLLAPRAGIVRRPEGDAVLLLDQEPKGAETSSAPSSSGIEGLSGTRRLVRLVLDAGDGTDQMLDMLLAKKRAGDRKSWLEKKGDLAGAAH